MLLCRTCLRLKWRLIPLVRNLIPTSWLCIYIHIPSLFVLSVYAEFKILMFLNSVFLAKYSVKDSVNCWKLLLNSIINIKEKFYSFIATGEKIITRDISTTTLMLELSFFVYTFWFVHMDRIKIVFVCCPIFIWPSKVTFENHIPFYFWCLLQNVLK